MWRMHNDEIASKKIAKKTYDPPQPTSTPTRLVLIGNVVVTIMTTINYLHSLHEILDLL